MCGHLENKLIFQHASFGVSSSSVCSSPPGLGDFLLSSELLGNSTADKGVSGVLLLNTPSCFTKHYLYWDILKPQMLLYGPNPLAQLLQIRHPSTFPVSVLLYKDPLFLHSGEELRAG